MTSGRPTTRHRPARSKSGEILEPSGAKPPSRPDAIRSYRVCNRRSLLDDHGTYFENDEEFTIPLLREIDAAEDWGEASRFYRDPVTDSSLSEAAPQASTAPPVATPVVSRDDPRAAGDERVLRHRQRVGLLAIWRHFSLSMAVAVVAIVLSSPTRLEELGKLVAGRLPRIPFLADAIDWLRGLNALTIDLPVLPAVDLLPAATMIGLATLQAIVIIAVLQLVAAPAGAYHVWPEGRRPAAGRQVRRDPRCRRPRGLADAARADRSCRPASRRSTSGSLAPEARRGCPASSRRS